VKEKQSVCACILYLMIDYDDKYDDGRADRSGDIFSAAAAAAVGFSISLSSTSASSSSSSPLPAVQQLAPSCNAVALTTVVKTTGDVSWSLAAMQAYQTLGCQAPGATGFGSTAFYGHSPSPHSSIPAGFYADGLSIEPFYATRSLGNMNCTQLRQSVCPSAGLSG